MNAPAEQSERSEQARRNLRDPQVLRALAHPARLAIMDYLGDGRSATATECAEVCGLSPSASSYHLRALARAGLIEEAPSRGDGRERVWHSPVRGFSIDVGQNPSQEELLAAKNLIHVLLARDDGVARTWLEHALEEPREWYEAAIINTGQLLLTAEEAKELTAKVEDWTRGRKRSDRKDAPPEARVVSLVFRMLPIR